MNDNTTINWNGYMYPGHTVSLVEQLRNFRNIYRKNNIEKVPSNQKQLPRNKNGVTRIAYYAGFTPWTNTPIANKNGGNI